MTTLHNTAGAAPAAPSRGLWALGWQRLKRKKVGFVSLWIVAVYLLLAVGGWFNLVGGGWTDEIAVPYAPPSWVRASADDVLPPEPAKPAQASAAIVTMTPEEDPIGQELQQARQHVGEYAQAAPAKRATLPFGADLRGRDVIEKTLKGTSTSIFVGVFGAVAALLVGCALGAAAGYFGGRVDDALGWFYSVFTSVPDMLLLLSFAAVSGRGITTIVAVMALTSWTGTFRLVRAEYLKLKGREYVQAADAIGAGNARKMFVHILPNISHLLLVQFSLLTVALIKYEAILSFLGFGVGVRQVSLGSMLAEAPTELIQGYWWQMLAVTLSMSLLVTAFSLLVDALRDALDPRAAAK
ncbi:ABC transporter permease [Chromobacterium haemolyticum]|uniref:ABC transporter permease n=1 Tax=Chromobacterium haemolyticum TaxID=394935 RepID=A0ABS3GTT4_9NEIS|nr:ABC transporter permease [Chromobacterium haemolyticum]MBK0417367.1 ABC transporter permease [Chromobacterium haemolyticum]MBO0418465.1 ABC transporter permease [Chromobacterium haemolyticum]MBO0501813.1 ABC transporter permease [Chromobacterium haemolyticum]